MKWLLFALSMAAVFALLHRQGLLVSKSIAAVLFVFRPGRNGDRASLNACTGWVRHRGGFREGGTYTFTLDAQLTGGDAEVLLLDRNKRRLLRLNRFHPEDSIELDGKSRYDIQWEFHHATGTCELRW